MPHIELKSVEQLRWMREAGLVVASIHEALRSAVRPGIATRELDEVSAQAIADGDAHRRRVAVVAEEIRRGTAVSDGLGAPPFVPVSRRASWTR